MFDSIGKRSDQQGCKKNAVDRQEEGRRKCGREKEGQRMRGTTPYGYVGRKSSRGAAEIARRYEGKMCRERSGGQKRGRCRTVEQGSREQKGQVIARSRVRVKRGRGDKCCEHSAGRRRRHEGTRKAEIKEEERRAIDVTERGAKRRGEISPYEILLVDRELNCSELHVCNCSTILIVGD